MTLYSAVGVENFALTECARKICERPSSGSLHSLKSLIAFAACSGVEKVAIAFLCGGLVVGDKVHVKITPANDSSCCIATTTSSLLEEYVFSLNVVVVGGAAQTSVNILEVVATSKFLTLRWHCHGMVDMLSLVVQLRFRFKTLVAPSFCAAAFISCFDAKAIIAVFEASYQETLMLHICKRADEVCAG